MPAIHKRPAAALDLENLASYLGQSDPALADLFLAATDRTLALLSSTPRSGAPFLLANPRLQQLWHHPIQGFPKHLIFYLPSDSCIEVVRVLHAVRDLHKLLARQP